MKQTKAAAAAEAAESLLHIAFVGRHSCTPEKQQAAAFGAIAYLMLAAFLAEPAHVAPRTTD